MCTRCIKHFRVQPCALHVWRREPGAYQTGSLDATLSASISKKNTKRKSKYKNQKKYEQISQNSQKNSQKRRAHIYQTWTPKRNPSMEPTSTVIPPEWCPAMHILPKITQNCQKKCFLFLIPILKGFYTWLALILGSPFGSNVPLQNQYTICKCLILMKINKKNI